MTTASMIQLPLTKNEYHYVQHCVAFFEAIMGKDEAIMVLIFSLIHENEMYGDYQARDALARKMNAISNIVFQDSQFFRK